MSLAYPIQAILMYFAILFSPPGATKITVDGPAGFERTELVREEGVWKVGGHTVAVEGGNLVPKDTEGQWVPIGEFAAIPAEGDRAKERSFKLGEGTTLEKTADGFTVSRSVASGEANGVYRVSYSVSPEAAPVGEITVNVLGNVRSPGVYKIPSDGSILDALAAAGGWTDQANLKKVSVIRGAAGVLPKVTVHDADGILNGRLMAPALKRRDTIMVPDKVF